VSVAWLLVAGDVQKAREKAKMEKSRSILFISSTSRQEWYFAVLQVLRESAGARSQVSHILHCNTNTFSGKGNGRAVVFCEMFRL